MFHRTSSPRAALALCIVAALVLAAAATPQPAARAGKLTTVKLKDFANLDGIAGWAEPRNGTFVVLAYDQPAVTERELRVLALKSNGKAKGSTQVGAADHDVWAGALAWPGDEAARLSRARPTGLIAFLQNERGVAGSQQTLATAVLKSNGKLKGKPVEITSFEAVRNVFVQRATVSVAHAGDRAAVAVAYVDSDSGRAHVVLQELNTRGQPRGGAREVDLGGDADSAYVTLLDMAAGPDGWLLLGSETDARGSVELGVWSVPWRGAARSRALRPVVIDKAQLPGQAERVHYEGARFLDPGSGAPDVAFTTVVSWPWQYARDTRRTHREYEHEVVRDALGRGAARANSLGIPAWSKVGQWLSVRNDSSVLYFDVAQVARLDNGDELVAVIRSGWYNYFGRSWNDPREYTSLYRLDSAGRVTSLFEWNGNQNYEIRQVVSRASGDSFAALFWQRDNVIRIDSPLKLLTY